MIHATTKWLIPALHEIRITVEPGWIHSSIRRGVPGPAIDGQAITDLLPFFWVAPPRRGSTEMARAKMEARPMSGPADQLTKKRD